MILSLSDGPWSPMPARLPRRAVTLRLLRVFSICLTVSRSSDTISKYLTSRFEADGDEREQAKG